MKITYKWHKWILAVFASLFITGCVSLPRDNHILYVDYKTGELVPSTPDNGAIIYDLDGFKAELGASNGAMANNHRKHQKEQQEKYNDS